jgi:hypothetical protein
MQKSAQKSSRIIAVFQNSIFSFELEREATFAQLAERLGNLGEAHGGLPLSVDVRVAGRLVALEQRQSGLSLRSPRSTLARRHEARCRRATASGEYRAATAFFFNLARTRGYAEWLLGPRLSPMRVILRQLPTI